MAYVPLNKIETAHQMYKDGKYKEALGCYTEALSVAKTKPQKIALHSNRAACFLKLHNFKKAAEECTSVLELDHDHTGALMLRAQTLVTLKEYHSALFDVNRLIELNPSSEVYQNLETRLRTQLSLAPIPESEAEIEEEEEEDDEDTTLDEHEEEEQSERGDADMMIGGMPEKNELSTRADDIIPKTPEIKDSSAKSMDKTVESKTTIASEVIAQAQKKAIEPRKTIASEVIAQVQRRTESRKTITAEVIAQAQRKVEPRKTADTEVTAQAQKIKESPEQQTKSWQAIPKPKGHSALDYARWDRVEEDSSEDDDEDDEESQPQYRFRVKTIGVRSVK